MGNTSCRILRSQQCIIKIATPLKIIILICKKALIIIYVSGVIITPLTFDNQVISPQNAWLNCGESVDKVLQQVHLQSISVAQQAGVLNRYGLLSKQMQGMVERFQALGVKLAEQSVNSRREEIYQEYQQLADHIMPTLERINQRVEARREAVGIKAETKITPPVADETVDVALRAALKRRS